MRNMVYRFLLSISIALVIVFIYSCDLTTPVDINLINLSEEELDFGLFTDELQFTVENNDTLDIYYDIQSWPDWITVTPSSGNLASTQTDTFVVSIDRTGLDIGDYGGDIYVEIMDAEEDLYIPVSMQIKPVPVFTPQQLNLNADDITGSFLIRNEGNHDLIWKALSMQNWLTVEPDSGVTEPGARGVIPKSSEKETMGNTSTLNVTINRNLLDPGVHVGLIVLDYDFDKDTLFVTVPQSEEPQISVVPGNLSFSKEEPAKYVTVDNSGQGLLEWQASCPDSWVTINPNTGTISTEAILSVLSKYNILTSTMSVNAVQVEISIDFDQAPEGDLTSRVEFVSNGGNQTVDLSINNVIPVRPVLDLSVNALDFGSTHVSVPFDIINTGTGTLEWSASSTEASLTLIPSSGSTTTSETVTVELNRALLTEPGSHTFTIDVTSNGGNDAVTVTVEVGQPPLLRYAPTDMALNKDNLSLPIHINNDGGGELKWHVIPNVDWLIVSADSGITTTATSEVMVSVNPAVALTPGTHNAIVDIFTNGGDGMVNLTYTLPENNQLLVTPQELNFGLTETHLTFEIFNVGTGTLNWTIDKAGTWFGVDQEAGSTATEPDVIEVTINRETLTPGDYTGYVIINSDGGVDSVKLTATVPAVPELDVSVNSINFSTSSTHETFYVKNNGGGEVTWDASITYIYQTVTQTKKTIKHKSKTEIGWLTIDPSFDVTSEQTLVNVYADRNYFTAAGIYQATIHIISNAGSKDINVEITIEGPDLSVDKTSLNFGANTINLSFNMRNTGVGELNWNSSIEYYLTNIPTWLSIDPQYGSFTGETTVSVAVSRSSLTSGIYEADIHLYSNGGDKDVHVIMEVVEPEINVSPTSLNFLDDKTQLGFTIQNVGGSTLYWSTTITYANTYDPQWLYVSPSYGGTTGESSVTAYATRNILSPGVYHATIHLNSNGGNIEVGVEITIPPASINASPALLDFGTTGTELPLEISNSGGGTLYYQLSSEQSWISFSVAGGTVTTNTDVITVYVNRSPATTSKASTHSRGNNSNTIYGSIWIQNINDSSNHETVNVQMTTLDPPVLDVNPTELVFGTEYTTLQIGIKNAGEDTLDWGVILSGPDAAIIHIDAANGTTTTETDIINVTVPRDLEPGDYSDSIDFSSNGGNISVPITWTVITE